MTLLNQVRRWLKREKSDIAGSWRETETRLDADLARKERQLHETPEEGLARSQAEIDATADPFEDVRRRIQESEDRGDA